MKAPLNYLALKAEVQGALNATKCFVSTLPVWHGGHYSIGLS